MPASSAIGGAPPHARDRAERTAPVDSRARAAAPRPALAGDLLLYVVLAALVLATWWLSRVAPFEPGDDAGYWIGVAGGVGMLLLFCYPLRKHLRFMRGWGATKWWFVAHMSLGVAGPLLILFHAKFRVGSVNAGVALYSMVVVALSGVVGRFLYVRIHRGLHGEITSLRELQARAGFIEQEARSRLHFVPDVEARLRAFEAHELRPDCSGLTCLRQILILPLQQFVVQMVCARRLRAALREAAARRGWDGRETVRRERHARKLVRRYLHAVVRVAHFTAYERMFALWHVAHVPFVYVMVLSAVVHVIAVHAY